MKAIHLLKCFWCSLISSCFRPPGKVGPISRVFAPLVDTSRRKFSPSQMPLAPSIRILHILVQYSPPQTVKERVAWPLFLQGLGLALVAKTRPHRPQAIKKANNDHTRFRRKIIFFPIFFLNEATAGTPRHVCKNFHANFRRSDLPMLMLSGT